MDKRWRASIFTMVLIVVGILSLFYSSRALADLLFYPVAADNLKTEIVLRPDAGTEQNIILQSDVLEARDIVARRLDQLNGIGSYQLVAQKGYLRLTLPDTQQTPYIVDLVSHVGQIEFIDGGAASPPLGLRIQAGPDSSGEDRYPVLFTAQDVEAVLPPQSETGQIFYRLRLTPFGAQLMAEFTTQHQGNYICMVIDRQVINCSSMYHLTDNNLDILPSLGSGNIVSLNDLAVFVKSGPLPIPLKIER